MSKERGEALEDFCCLGKSGYGRWEVGEDRVEAGSGVMMIMSKRRLICLGSLPFPSIASQASVNRHHVRPAVLELGASRAILLVSVPSSLFYMLQLCFFIH